MIQWTELLALIAQGAAGEGKGQHLRKSRASVSCDQVLVQPSQGVLSGTGQEHQSAAGDVSHFDSVDGAQANIAGVWGMNASAALAKTPKKANHVKTPSNRQQIPRWFRHVDIDSSLALTRKLCRSSLDNKILENCINHE